MEIEVRQVKVVIIADLIEGQTPESVTKAELYGCENARVITAHNYKEPKYKVEELTKILFEQLEEVTGFTKEQITASDRHRNKVYCRYIIMWHLRDQIEKISLKSVGEICGRYDHTTVKYGLQTVDNLIHTNDQEFMEIFNSINI